MSQGKTLCVGLIGGSGLGEALTRTTRGTTEAIDTPFGPPSAPIVRAEWGGVPIAFLARHGPGHTLPPSAVPYRANIYALKRAGCTHIIASGATGSLQEEVRPGELVVPDQLIDRTHRRAGSFFDEPGLAAHVEFSHPFCPTLRGVLLAAGADAGLALHADGTYVCMEGPAFSTVAESRMHRAWGGDLVGMTASPEARLAREAELCYALVALPTDYDCWRPAPDGLDRHALLAEIIGNMERVTAQAIKLIEAALRRCAASPPPACACQTCLDLAVWTKPGQVSPAVAARLEPILRRWTAARAQG